MRTTIKIAAITLTALVCKHTFAESVTKKFVAFGHEMESELTPEKLKANQPELAKTGLSGVGVYLPKFKSVNCLSNQLKSVVSDLFLWQKEDFGDSPVRYREVLKLPGLRHSFIKTFFHHPIKRLDWTDDEVWQRIAHNMRVAAWFAKASGFKGLCVDHEDYGRARQFLRKPDELPYSELCELARKRGRDLFRGVFEEFPDAVLLFYWFLTADPIYLHSPDALSIAETKADLWPAFANGILDVIPQTARIVEGNEWSYSFESTKSDFLRSSVEQRDGALGLLTIENRLKYRTVIQAGSGLYLDMYVNPKFAKDGKTPNFWYCGPVNGSRLVHFDRNATAAAFSANEYVWIWGERGNWVHWKPSPLKWLKDDPIWSDRLPGLHDVLAAITDPEAYADRKAAELQEKGVFHSFVWNGTCDPHAKGLAAGFTGDEAGKSLPAPFYFWYDDQFRHGKAGIDIGGGEGGGNALRVEGVGFGCIIYNVPEEERREGDMFVLEASIKGRAYVEFPDHSVNVGGDPAVWRTFRGLLRIGENMPKSVGVKFVFHQDVGESAWVDNVRIVRVFRASDAGCDMSRENL